MRERAPTGERDLLLALLAYHTALLKDIEALVDRGSDDQRSDLILAEVNRRNEEMAWMLAALLEDSETVAHFPDKRSDESPRPAARAQGERDNKGRRVRITP